MRFSLLALIGFVALAAVGCAALVNANELWLVAVSTTTFAIMTAAVIAALFARGRSQAFAGGFAIGCLGYLVLVYFVLANENTLVSRLATTKSLINFYRLAGRFDMDLSVLPTAYSSNFDHVMQIGQQLWAILIGCLGGVFASYLWRHRREVEGAKNS